MLSEIDLLALREFLFEIVNKANIDESSIEAVKHYISHAEYEMAFEGLFIDLIEINFYLSDKQKEMAMNFGKQMGLDHESVFSDSFWDGFLNYVGK